MQNSAEERQRQRIIEHTEVILFRVGLQWSVEVFAKSSPRTVRKR